MADIPDEPPPSYEAVSPTTTGASSNHHNRLSVPGSHSPTSSVGTASTFEHPHGIENGVSGRQRASMEDEVRPLPEGWVRRFDANYGHHFYVDTRKDPPRSIWHHPYDDDEYRTSAPSEDPGTRHRAKLAKSSGPSSSDKKTSDKRRPSDAKRPPPPQSAPSDAPLSQSTSAAGASTSEGKRTFGRKLKDKVTSSTHDERVAKRREQAERERLAYERQAHVRRCFQEADRTGRPVLIGRRREDGKEVYAEPGMDPYGGYGGGGYYGGAPYGPYSRRGPYGSPYGYGGYGYGGGAGLPLLGGLAGGLLLGGLLGGF